VEERTAFYRFSKAATRRYGPNGSFWTGKPWPRSVRPRYWQVWNEPNLPNWWNGRGVEPKAYGRFLKYTSMAAKDGDRDARIVSAGLPQTTCESGPCIDEFLREMWRVPNISDWVDVVAIQPYAEDYRGIFRLLGLARNQTIRSLGKSKPLMVTEFGWGTGGRHRHFSATESGQASLLRDAFNKMIEYRLRYRLRGAYWFGFKDFPMGASWQYHTGLFDRDWRMKPAWKALVSITRGRL
jgi:hypothetical protein